MSATACARPRPTMGSTRSFCVVQHGSGRRLTPIGAAEVAGRSASRCLAFQRRALSATEPLKNGFPAFADLLPVKFTVFGAKRNAARHHHGNDGPAQRNVAYVPTLKTSLAVERASLRVGLIRVGGPFWYQGSAFGGRNDVADVAFPAVLHPRSAPAQRPPCIRRTCRRRFEQQAGRIDVAHRDIDLAAHHVARLVRIYVALPAGVRTAVAATSGAGLLVGRPWRNDRSWSCRAWPASAL